MLSYGPWPDEGDYAGIISQYRDFIQELHDENLKPKTLFTSQVNSGMGRAAGAARLRRVRDVVHDAGGVVALQYVDKDLVHGALTVGGGTPGDIHQRDAEAPDVRQAAVALLLRSHHLIKMKSIV